MQVKIIIPLLCLLLVGCFDDEAPNPAYFEALVELDDSGIYFEEVHTFRNFRAKSFSIEQSIDKDRNVDVFELGFLVSTSPNPTYDPENINLQIVSVDLEDIEFPTMINAKALDLEASTTYFVRAFADIEAKGERKLLLHPNVEQVVTEVLFSDEINRTPDNIQLITRLNEIEEHLDMTSYGLILTKNLDQILNLEYDGLEKVEISDDFPFELFVEHGLDYDADRPVQRFRPFYIDATGEAFYGLEGVVWLYKEVVSFENELEFGGAQVVGTDAEFNGIASAFLFSGDPETPNRLQFFDYDPFVDPTDIQSPLVLNIPEADEIWVSDMLGLPTFDREMRFCGAADGQLLLGSLTDEGVWDYNFHQPDWGDSGQGGNLSDLIYDANINSFFFLGESPDSNEELLFILRTNFNMDVNSMAQYYVLDFINAPYQTPVAIADDPFFNTSDHLLMIYQTQTSQDGPPTSHFALLDKLSLNTVYETTTEATYLDALTLEEDRFLLVGTNVGIGEFRLINTNGTTLLRRQLPEFETILSAHFQNDESIILTGYNAANQLVFSQISITGQLRWVNQTEFTVDIDSDDPLKGKKDVVFKRSQEGLLGVHPNAGNWYVRRLNANGTLKLE